MSSFDFFLRIVRRLAAGCVVVARTFRSRIRRAETVRQEREREHREAPSRMNGWLH
jgi:hypothetical protein